MAAIRWVSKRWMSALVGGDGGSPTRDAGHATAGCIACCDRSRFPQAGESGETSFKTSAVAGGIGSEESRELRSGSFSGCDSPADSSANEASAFGADIADEFRAMELVED